MGSRFDFHVPTSTQKKAYGLINRKIQGRIFGGGGGEGRGGAHPYYLTFFNVNFRSQRGE